MEGAGRLDFSHLCLGLWARCRRWIAAEWENSIGSRKYFWGGKDKVGHGRGLAAAAGSGILQGNWEVLRRGPAGSAQGL